MRTVYLYVTNTMADWEIGHLTAEIHSRRFFKKDASEISLKTISLSDTPVKTMGGLNILPDCVFNPDIILKEDILVLPGSDEWSDPRHKPILDFAIDHLNRGGTLCAICGATLALAFRGVLDSRKHTSNGPGFLEMLCPGYKGSAYFVDEPAVSDGNLITAGATGGLQFAKLILKELGVFSDRTLEAWTKYFTNGRPEDFFELMDSVQNS